MTITILKRQIITDSVGEPVGVILPLKEYDLVKNILEQHDQMPDVEKMLAKMEFAISDDLFLSDLLDTMSAYEAVDAEWWEPAP